MSRIVVNPADRVKHEQRKAEWGEEGPAHNISHDPVTVANRAVIALNAKGNVAKNSTERQKQRTFV